MKREGAGGIVVAKAGSGPINNNSAAGNSLAEIGITEKLGKAASLVSKMFESDNQLGAGEKQKLLKIYESKIERLRNAIHNIVKESVGNVLYADNLHVTELCASVESILFHGILDTKFFGTTTYWDYLENISNCVPNGGDILNKIRKTTEITTDLGFYFPFFHSFPSHFPRSSSPFLIFNKYGLLLSFIPFLSTYLVLISHSSLLSPFLFMNPLFPFSPTLYEFELFRSTKMIFQKEGEDAGLELD